MLYLSSFNYKHLSITIGSQNHQLNHLPPVDLKNLNCSASSELCRKYTKKKQARDLYHFLD